MKFHARTACLAGCLGLFGLQGPFALAQTAVNGVTVYGIADLGIRQASGLTPGNAPSPGSSSQVGSGIDTTSRLGFRGREDLGAGLTALFNLESGLNLNDGTSINRQKWFDRAAFLGLSGEAGTLTLAAALPWAVVYSVGALLDGGRGHDAAPRRVAAPVFGALALALYCDDRTDAGHSAMEAQTVIALTAIMDGLPRL